MTAGFIVVLEEDLPEESARSLMVTLRRVKGVISVEPVPHDVRLSIAETRAKIAFTDMLHRVWEKAQGDGPNSVLPIQ